MGRGTRYLWLAGLVILVGCGGPDKVYERENFELDSPYQWFTGLPVDLACEGARRALLGQGYIIEEAVPESVRGKKSFRNAGDESIVLEMTVVCTPRGNGATLFANAVQSLYRVKKNSQSASVGVPLLGSISVPIQGSSDSMVKAGDDTVNDKGFYQRFFAVVEYYLEEVAATRQIGAQSALGTSEPPAAPATEIATPGPVLTAPPAPPERLAPPETGGSPAPPAAAPSGAPANKPANSTIAI